MLWDRPGEVLLVVNAAASGRMPSTYSDCAGDELNYTHIGQNPDHCQNSDDLVRGLSHKTGTADVFLVKVRARRLGRLLPEGDQRLQSVLPQPRLP